jgi:hypothetical protein
MVTPFLLLNLTRPNWVVTGDSEEQRIDRQTESGIRCVGQSGGNAQGPHCFLSLLISSLYSASFLYLYSLRPYSFTIL